MSHHDLTAYGASPGTDDIAARTRAVQQAIDACAEAGGGIVSVPAGRYVVASLRLRSHVTLRLESGAALVASPEPGDYAEVTGVPSGRGFNRVWLWARGERDLCVQGPGVLDFNGDAFMKYGRARTGPDFTQEMADRLDERQLNDAAADWEGRPNFVIQLDQCEHIRFEGVSLLNAPSWATRFYLCSDLLFRGVRIISDLRVPNADGLHFNACHDVVIADSIFRCGDDCIAITGIGAEETPSERFVVSNCIFTSRSSAIRVGHAKATVRDCTFSNCLVTNSNRGVGIFARGEGGLVERIRIAGFHISTRLHAGNWWGRGEPVVVHALEGGRVRDVQVKDLRADCEQGLAVVAEPAGAVQDVVLDDVALRLSRGRDAELMGGRLDLQPGAIVRRDIPGVLLRGVTRARLRDVSVTWHGPRADYFGPALATEESSDVDGGVSERSEAEDAEREPSRP